MLPPITKEYSDLSTDRYFEFAFRCDVCGAPWLGERYPFSLADRPPREGEEDAHTALYRAEHDAAYERANLEALFHFSKCQRCGRRVCDSCLTLGIEDLCVDCAREKEG